MLFVRQQLGKRWTKIFTSCGIQNTRRTITDLGELRKQAELKYADKLHQRVKREGVSSLEELKSKLSSQSSSGEQIPLKATTSSLRPTRNTSFQAPVRKDSSPVKPLADLMDVQKLLAKEHTADQISALWTAYHATRSQGTGRGYLSATIPLQTYVKMTSLAEKYPTFLLPLPRPSQETHEVAYEFFFLQWEFHGIPPHSSQTPALPFETQVWSPPTCVERNPARSTVLFTPLQEYKLRQTFAQPYLVLTHYTDLATTHGIVLLRGEITASPSSAGNYLISQSDAQLLAFGVQRFYLSSGEEESEERAELLRKFHEEPGAFQWEKLLASGGMTA